MKKIKRILFYHGLSRALRTTLLGHLWRLCQVYPVVLLSDGLGDEEIRNVLENKKLFPKLEKIIFVPPEPKSKMKMFKYHRQIRKLMKNTVEFYKPDVIIAPNDLYPPEMYLFRFGQRIKALCLAVQSSLELDMVQLRKSVRLVNAYLRFPGFLPKFLRFFLAQARQYVLHFFVYWLAPFLAGEKPFFGKSSYVLRNKSSGLRDADYQIVFSQREYGMYSRFSGVPKEKLYVLKHPLALKSFRDFFRRQVLKEKSPIRKPSASNGASKVGEKKAAVLLLPSDELGFRKNGSFISSEEREKERIRIIALISRALKGWKILVKPHPNFKNYDKNKKTFELVSDNVRFINPSESTDKYIAESKLVIGLPRSASTALFGASLLFPEKPILSLDFQKELLGDTYKEFPGIEYIDSEEKFSEMLNRIKLKKYRKKAAKHVKKEKEFVSAAALVEHLFQKV